MQSIFQEHFDSYAKQRRLSTRELRAADAIMKCGTPAMGGHVLSCPEGHFERIQYHSCRHRSCPRCAERPRQQWVQATLGRLLPCEHFHAVFTLPHVFLPLWAFNRERLASVLLDSARESLLQLCADPRHLGARVGLLLALHTWGRTLSQHPHVHCLVSAGGIDPNGQWKNSRTRYLVPVKALSALFRGKLLARLSQLLQRGQLQLPSAQPLAHWRQCISQQYRKHWNVQLAERYEHGRGVALYLARYVKGGPLPRTRPLWHHDERVSFAYTDHRDGNPKTMSLAPEQFLARVLWHAPPRGQHMVRYAGLYTSAAAPEHARARSALTAQTPPAMPATLASRHLDTPTAFAVKCPMCQAPLRRTLSLLPVHRHGAFSKNTPASTEALSPTISSNGHPPAGDTGSPRRLLRRHGARCRAPRCAPRWCRCHFIARDGQLAAAPGPWYPGAVQCRVCHHQRAPHAAQISPGKNANCRCASAAFTVGCAPVGFAVMCQLASQPWALYAVSVRRLAPLALGLPPDDPSRFRPCRRLVVILALMTSPSRYSHRGLAPHKFAPMLGAHPSVEPTRSGLRPPRAAHLKR